MSRTSTDPAAPRHVLSGATMGTRWTAVVPALAPADAPALAAALGAATDEVDRQMSTWKPASDLMRLNGAPLKAWVPLPAALVQVLAAALAIGRLSEGAFDVGVGSAVATWGFGATPGQNGGLPPRALPAIDLLELDEGGGRARKHAPAMLDLSGIAKGFGVDRMAAALDGLGVADYLVGIDGELRARGARADGTPFAIALERPDPGRREAMGVITLADAAVATSGDYRHSRTVGARRVSHTIDPRSGEPVRHDLASVSVLAQTAMAADAFATALMVAGPDRGPAMAGRLGLGALFVTRDGTEFRVAGTGAFAREGAAGTGFQPW